MNNFDQIIVISFLLLAILGVIGTLVISIITEMYEKKILQNQRQERGKRITKKSNNNDRLKILLSEENIIEKINTIIDSLISNAANNYLILTIQDDKKEGYISPDIEEEMSQYIYLTVKNNMTKDVKDMISMIYIIDGNKLNSLLKLRIKFYMINRIINNNAEK